MPRLARWCGCEDTPSRNAFIILIASFLFLSVFLRLSPYLGFDPISLRETRSCLAYGGGTTTYHREIFRDVVRRGWLVARWRE